jgi:putative tricarboxylic transport membrane protein
MYGGSTTSILLNTPGESASVVTTIEGFQMAKSGRNVGEGMLANIIAAVAVKMTIGQ